MTAWIELDIDQPIWNRFYTVAPLVVIGTKEDDQYDLAPKHMAMPLGHQNYFGFVCTPRHATYHNALQTGEFSVSYPRSEGLVTASLAATPRTERHGEKSIVNHLETIPAKYIDALLVRHSYLFLECQTYKIIDGFGDFGLVSGKIVAARVHKEAYRVLDESGPSAAMNIPLLAYLAYGKFAEIKESHAFPFPRGFLDQFITQ